MTWDLSQPTLPARNPCQYCGRHIEQQDTDIWEVTSAPYASDGTRCCEDSPDSLHAPREQQS
jgi:hypothetical protein